MSTTPPDTTIYIVDDDESVRTGLARLMRSAGFVAVAVAGIDALMNLAPFSRPSCVIADICMPGASGLELPVLLRRRGEHVPVIFVTANDTEETRAEAKLSGATGYFRKPVDDQALLDQIRWVLGDANGKQHGHTTATTTS